MLLFSQAKSCDKTARIQLDIAFKTLYFPFCKRIKSKKDFKVTIVEIL